ncbi:MAG: helix-turn-helix transcriptional regulator [Candidatus Zambryskibacteria bacterium]|nr:helix-turn-helix transcriptional regulator [Candidatus Zambryskibacteria bacterium]
MKKIHGFKTYTLEEVLKEPMKNKKFRIGYEKEVARLNLVHQIKTARLAKKYTQEKLAKKADMPQSVIARIESGKRGMSFETISRIASALGKEITFA